MMQFLYKVSLVLACISAVFTLAVMIVDFENGELIMDGLLTASIFVIFGLLFIGLDS